MSRIFKLGRYFYDLDNIWRCAVIEDTDCTTLTINEEVVRIYKPELAKKAKQLLDEFVGKGKAKK